MESVKRREGQKLDRMMVRIEHLDTLLNLVGEVIITSNNIATANRRVQEFYDRKEPLDKLSMDMIRSSELISNRISSDLHSLVMAIRMVEVRSTFQRFRRVVRDVAKEGGKQVELVMSGEETLVDKTIAEKLYDPLNHQIRNAVDHGIEDPLERRRAGKPEKAVLSLKAYQRENDVFIEVADDGRGIDPEAVAKAAVERGLVEEDELSRMTDDQKLGFIFHPGFSTRSTASRISGRGVGMDVVKNNIEQLGGEIIIDTRPGRGTSFIYRIPQVTAVNILDCLTVRAGTGYYALPILNVVATLAVPAERVSSALGKGRTIMYLGSLVSLFDMAELLGDGPLPPERELTVVIVEAKNGRIALRVSELMSPEKLVFSPLADIFRVQGVSGTASFSGERMGLVVHVEELVRRSKGLPPEWAREEEGPEERERAAEPVQETPAAREAPPGTAVMEEEPMTEGEISHREEFFAELEDILKEVDQDLLTLENSPGDTELLNRIFRAFHSMKGNLMMVGLSELGGFIHEVEAVLDQARSGETAVDSGVIDLLLDSADAVKTALDSMTKGQKPTIDEALLGRLEGYRKPEREAEKPPMEPVSQRTFHIGALERFNLMALRYSGQSVYQVYLSFRPRYQSPFLAALLILKRIAMIGHIFGSVPTVDEIKSQRIESQMKVMFSSELSREDLEGYIQDILVRHYDVDDYEILKAA